MTIMKLTVSFSDSQIKALSTYCFFIVMIMINIPVRRCWRRIRYWRHSYHFYFVEKLKLKIALNIRCSNWPASDTALIVGQQIDCWSLKKWICSIDDNLARFVAIIR